MIEIVLFFYSADKIKKNSLNRQILDLFIKKYIGIKYLHLEEPLLI